MILMIWFGNKLFLFGLIIKYIFIINTSIQYCLDLTNLNGSGRPIGRDTEALADDIHMSVYTLLF